MSIMEFLTSMKGFTAFNHGGFMRLEEMGTSTFLAREACAASD